MKYILSKQISPPTTKKKVVDRFFFHMQPAGNENYHNFTPIFFSWTLSCNSMHGSKGWWVGGPDPPPPPPLQNHKNIGFLSNTCPDPLKNHKATKTAFNVGPSRAGQRNAIKMTFRWRPMMARIKWWYLDPLSPHVKLKKQQQQKPISKLDPL